MDRLLRIAYFDLGLSKEEYGLLPTCYGGGAVAARYLKEDPEVDFHVFAPIESFHNVSDYERVDRCQVLTPETIIWLRSGGSLDALEGFIGMGPWDIVMHSHTHLGLNPGILTCPVVHFCGFDGSAGHPTNHYILLYDPSFRPQFEEKAKYVRIGKPVPEAYTPHPKAPYVFQCSRHDETMNTLEVARACRRFAIQGYFAGPIREGYPLMEEIDGKVTHYLGQIDEATKMGYYRHARLFTLAHVWPDLPFNQSCIEAQGQGTPIWAARMGPFLGSYLQVGVNGFDSRETPLLEAFNRAPDLDGRACWAAARAYDVSVMVASFKQAFREISTEWRTR